jgi:signal transduction histidine kinase
VCVHNDTRDRLWIGFVNARLSLRDVDGTYRHFGAETFGAEATNIHAVFESSDGVIWVATDAGLTTIGDDGAFTFNHDHGLPSDRVWSVTEDDADQLWLSLDVGVIRIERTELQRAVANRAHRLRYEFFDAADGLAGAPILRVRSGHSPDGTVWFVRGGALTIAQAPVLRAWPQPTNGPVRIEGATVDERTVDTSATIDLAAETKRLEIDYTAVALAQPRRMRFRYKLEGFDTDWIQAGMRRTAVYTNLPPRQYQFVVEAGTEREGWTGSSARWQFTIAPAFYQTTWFYGAVLAGTALIVLAAWRFRVGLMHREYAAVLGERTRLSREIHDTLLQGVVGVALQLDAIAHSVGSVSTEAREKLVRARHDVEAYIREARQSISDLRSPLLDSRHLPDVLADFGREATAGTPVKFAVAVSGRARSCSPRLENELLRIGQEAITNSIRHSHATRIRLELRYTEDTVTLTVVDDGCGISLEREGAAMGEAHYGLIVMRERAENLGGHVSIAPVPEGGTRIEAVLPAPVAV